MTMREQLPATVESVAAARRAVRDFAADLEVDVDGMTLAVSEAVANVVAHAYAGDASGVIDLSATASPFEVAIVVRDRGGGLDAARGSHGAGFGIQIIRRLAQHVALDDSASGVALTMRFRRGGAWSGR
ncbi:MAG TPA: ATP-binding protein [Solirubrobacteraceae bacterium]|nr:ATP-binding protein [Solirubrobacteraceae bacterium]